jgi:hypothetical protein
MREGADQRVQVVKPYQLKSEQMLSGGWNLEAVKPQLGARATISDDKMQDGKTFYRLLTGN